MQKLRAYAMKIGAIGAGVLLFGAGMGCVSDADHEQALKDAEITCGQGTVMNEDGTVCLPAEAIEPKMVDKEVQVFNELWSDDYNFGEEIVAQLGDNKIVKLMDDKVEVDDEEYDVAEYLSFGWDNSELMLVTSSEADKEMEGDSYLHVGEGSIRYEYRFEDALPELDEDVTIKFLGKDMKIVGFGEENDGWIRVKKADSDMVGVYRVDKDGKVLDGEVGKAKVINIGRDSVIVDVNGEREVVPLTDDGTTVTVNGVEICVESIFYEDAKSERMVELTVGDDIEREIHTDDSYDPDVDEDDSEFVWDIDTSVDEDGKLHLHEVALKYNQLRKDVDSDSDFKALAVGEEIDLLGYLKIKLAGTNEPNYLTVDLYDKEDDVYKLVGNFVYDVEGSEDYDKVYLFNGKFYEDLDHSEDSLIGAELKLDDTKSTLTASLVVVGEVEEQHLVLNVGNEVHELLHLDVEFVEDETVMTPYGVKFVGSEDWLDNSDKLTVKVPEEKLEGNLVVGEEVTETILVPVEEEVVEDIIVEE